MSRKLNKQPAGSKLTVFDALRCLETGFFTVAAGDSEETRNNPVSDYPRASHI
ncbi:MAG: hypothetical protein ACM65M_12030 [Microcoleus sp.]